MKPTNGLVSAVGSIGPRQTLASEETEAETVPALNPLLTSELSMATFDREWRTRGFAEWEPERAIGPSECLVVTRLSLCVWQ